MHSEPKSPTRGPSVVSRQRREGLRGHRGVTLWLTGLSGSGKSTLANALDEALTARGAHSYVLDGDALRRGLNADLGFAPADRAENVRRAAEVARLMTDAGLIVMAAFISPYRADRARARSLYAADDFVEVYLDADLASCEARDPKGLYARARAGQIPEFTGVSAPYEPPERPELRVPSATESVAESLARVMEHLRARGVFDTPVP